MTAAFTGLLASCGVGGEDQASGGPAPEQGFEVKSGDLFNDDSGKIIDRYGATNPIYDASGRRQGAREGALVNQQFTGDFARQRYEGDLREYQKRSFWGRKDYARQVYDGGSGGGLVLREAREGAVAAREGARAAGEGSRVFQSDAIQGKVAQEERGRPLARPTDAETDLRRRVFEEPEVKNWRRQSLGVEDTRAMLGR